LIAKTKRIAMVSERWAPAMNDVDLAVAVSSCTDGFEATRMCSRIADKASGGDIQVFASPEFSGNPGSGHRVDSGNLERLPGLGTDGRIVMCGADLAETCARVTKESSGDIAWHRTRYVFSRAIGVGWRVCPSLVMSEQDKLRDGCSLSSYLKFSSETWLPEVVAVDGYIFGGVIHGIDGARSGRIGYIGGFVSSEERDRILGALIDPDTPELARYRLAIEASLSKYIDPAFHTFWKLDRV
jgi:hypothetical protein